MYYVLAAFAIAVVIVLFKTARVVPQKSICIVERWGRYSRSLEAGLHLLVPFVDRVAYVRTMKETPIDVPPQQCITRDNIAVDVDGILYLQVMDPVKASYGIDNYIWASTQLAQTTMRSEIGKLELERTFEERSLINSAICSAVDKASDPWGIKVTRYEIKSVTPPKSIRDAMEKQMRAEREKRAMIAESEGERQAKINRAEGTKQEAVAYSEGEKIRQINVAEGRAQELSLVAAGRAQEIKLVAEATANGIRQIASAISETAGGQDAVNLRLAEQYITEFGKIAKEGNTMVLPANLADIAGVLKLATSVIKKG